MKKKQENKWDEMAEEFWNNIKEANPELARDIEKEIKKEERN